MNVYQKLNEAREKFHGLKLVKTGENKFAGYKYFELGDFLIPAMGVFKEVGLCAIVSFDADKACMLIRNVDKPDEFITIYSPMGSAALKGCHEVQNIGAVETYQRRYLWVAALEIVEHDALDATTGKDAKPAGVISATGEAYKSLSPDWKAYVDSLATEIENTFEQQGAEAARDVYEQAKAADKLEAEHIAATWYKVSSKARSSIKALEAIKKVA